MTNTTTTEVHALRERLDALRSERDRLTARQIDLRADYIEAEGTARGLREALARGDRGVDAGTVAAAQPTASTLAAALATVDAELSTTDRAIARVEAELTDAETVERSKRLLTEDDVQALIVEYQQRVDAILFELGDKIQDNSDLFNDLRIQATAGTNAGDAPVRFENAPEGERITTPHGAFWNRGVGLVLDAVTGHARYRWGSARGRAS